MTENEKKYKALKEFLTYKNRSVYRVTNSSGIVKYTSFHNRRFGQNKLKGGWNEGPDKLTSGVGSNLDFLRVHDTEKDLLRERKILGIKEAAPSPLTEEKAEESETKAPAKIGRKPKS